MAGKAKLTDSVISHVRNKLTAMCRVKSQKEVAASFGMAQQTISAIIRGAANPSVKTAEKILGESVENHSTNARRPVDHRLRKPKRLQPRDEASSGVRDEPVRAREGDLPGVPRPGDVDNVVQLAQVESKVTKLGKTALIEFERHNKTRRLAGLSPLVIRAYSCMGCRKKFESTGARFCAKCKHVEVAVLSGQEIYE